MVIEAVRIVYEQMPLFLGGVKEARYKGVVATIAEGEDWVSIYTIESQNKQNGEVNEFINLLRQDYPNKKLWSSVPLNSIWDYIAHKHKIKHIEG